MPVGLKARFGGSHRDRGHVRRKRRTHDCARPNMMGRYAILSAMRARLSSRPSTFSTSKMGGEVVRPVSAARKG